VGFLNFCGRCKTCTSQCGTMKFCTLTDLQGMNNFKTTFVKNEKYEDGGQLKVKILILLYGDNS
jgi:hypothetical protein